MEQQKPLEGGSWTVSALYLQGISLARRNNEWHHFDPLGTAQVITNGSAQVVSNNLYDVFGVLRYEQGSAQTPWRWGRQGEESLVWNSFPYLAAAAICTLRLGCKDPAYRGCLTLCNAFAAYCKALPNPWANSLCSIVLRYGCYWVCRDIKRWNPFPDCATPCSTLPEGQCIDCCNATCPNRGSLKICYDRCATKPVYASPFPTACSYNY